MKEKMVYGTFLEGENIYEITLDTTIDPFWERIAWAVRPAMTDDP